ncbi:MAG: AbrB/MazE/SpoVT family DNA-binding domain-containing protein [Haloarculaceae archaeon]
MQTRKLQEVGGGTYTVSVPKEWADDHGIEAGEEVHVYTHADGSVVLRTAEKDGGELAATQVEVEGDDPAPVRRAVLGAHAVGFETVTVVPAGSGAFTDDQRRAARSVVTRLVGTDLVVERDDEIAVQHLLDASSVSVRQSVVQLQYVALSIHRRATAAFVDADTEAAERLPDRRDEAGRLARMVGRHFARSLVSLDEVDRLGVSRAGLFDCYVVARQLDRVAAQGVRVARAADRLTGPLPDPVGDDVAAVAETTRTVVDDAATAVLDGGTVGAAHDALDAHDGAVADVDAVERALWDVPGAVDDPGDAVAATRTLDALARTADCGGAIANVALRAAVRSETL